MTKRELPDLHLRLPLPVYRHLQAVAVAMDRSAAYIAEKIIQEWYNAERSDDPDDGKP